MYLPLSLISKGTSLKEINQILEGYEGIINDLSPLPHIEYSTEDLLKVWTKLMLILE